nr:MAG TPA: arginine repressor [Caudoviricetes sp.]
MSDLHSDLREAQRVLSEAGIRTAKHAREVLIENGFQVLQPEVSD